MLGAKPVSKTRQFRSPASARGFSVIESLVSVAIAGTVVTTAATSIAPWRAQWAVTGTAAAFETDIQNARSLALERRETVRMSLDDGEHGACWIVHNGPRAACRCGPGGQPECTPGVEAFRFQALPADQGTRVAANVTSMAFDPTLGTVTPAATVRFSATGAKTVHQVLGIMGRVRSCVPGGGLAGYRAC